MNTNPNGFWNNLWAILLSHWCVMNTTETHILDDNFTPAHFRDCFR